MNVLDGAETLEVIDHLHVLGTVRHLASEKRETAEPHCQEDGREKAIELLIRDCPSSFPLPVQLYEALCDGLRRTGELSSD